MLNINDCKQYMINEGFSRINYVYSNINSIYFMCNYEGEEAVLQFDNGSMYDNIIVSVMLDCRHYKVYELISVNG